MSIQKKVILRFQNGLVCEHMETVASEEEFNRRLRDVVTKMTTGNRPVLIASNPFALHRLDHVVSIEFSDSKGRENIGFGLLHIAEAGRKES